MKYATLLLGLAILTATIAVARAEPLNCGGIIVEPVFRPLCPASVPDNDCKSWELDGISFPHVAKKGLPIRIDFIWKNTNDYKTATLNGRRCKIPE
jgi:hypothetical protein